MTDYGARLKTLQERLLPRIMKAIDDVLVQGTPPGSTLVEMSRYHFETGGKRLRAMLPCLVAEVLGEDPERAVPLGAACEMLHNATLVHDDLQDGDTHRRDRETVWKKFGAPQAINLGDAMFYYTVLLMQRLDLSLEARDRLLQSAMLDTLKIIDGQEREFHLKHEHRPPLADYLTMVQGKTSALLSLTLGGGATVAGARPAMVEALREIGRHLGLVFQIQDDVLDLYGDKGRTRPGEDVAEGKRSCLVVHAANTLEGQDHARLIHILDLPKPQTTDAHIAEVRALFEKAGSLRFALDEIERRREAALAAAGGTGDREVLRLTEFLCDLFLEPIGGLLPGAPRPGSEDDAAPSQTPASASTSNPASDSADSAFLLRMLPEVSRTFALSIEALPEPLRSSVRTSYLLCRIVDTIEDDPNISPELRVDMFRQFEGLMRGVGDARAFEQTEHWARDDRPDYLLCRGAGHVFASFERMPEATRNRVRAPILEMAGGMNEYTQRAAREGSLRIRDLSDLDRYCYFVAGTVGQLLTSLFLEHTGLDDAKLRETLEERAVAFGQGLQLVNVLKDVQADLKRDVCYLPEDVLLAEGLSRQTLMSPSQRPARARAVTHVCQRARSHLDRAVEYTLAWPAEQAAAVRFFCAVPLGLALGTLREIERGAADDRIPKLERAEVMSLFTRAEQAVHENDHLQQLLSDLNPSRSSRVGA